ncbi:MFS transporter [Pseudomonas ogarae]|uniref:MFS transporter n=1 Tax=Pseudomonas ogarae (strain DSM 112162 / CECT 30235 / F113) TaxID=1114970 RepID=UPI0009A2A18E|nr:MULTISPECIES: MFS transporter [Pseudomonas]OPG72258.1 MFS transporter [Pseudomonas ogarae]OPG81332.1 MFS transporter [Pseudomonas ogarae]PBJ03512.1 enterobactin exporter EntS [Pseudomonas ogarae]QXH92349.1 MFS transporter [Pseudomonas zarinae]
MPVNTSLALENPAPALARDRNFRRLLACAVASMLGDQFTLVAFPLLIMVISPDPMALGWAFAALALPRALFLLTGGSLVDRFGARSIWSFGCYGSALALCGLAWAVYHGQATLPVIYGAAALLGLCSALTLPAGSALVPGIVNARDLERANGILLALRQVTIAVGPVAAGGVIASAFWPFGPRPAANATLDGYVIAFVLDALTFALSAFGLRALPVRRTTGSETSAGTTTAEGLRYFFQDRRLRTYLTYMAAMTLLMSGPVQVALPLLTHERFTPEAPALGWLFGAQGAGTLVGMLMFTARPKLRMVNLGVTLLAVDAAIALLLMPLGWVYALWQGVALLFAIGLCGGFVQVMAFTWLQRSLPPRLLGRGMSLFMLVFFGLAPVSAAIAGWVLQFVSIQAVFLATGALLLAAVLMTYFGSGLRRLSDV